MTGSGNYGPSLVLTLLYEKRSARGQQYFAGRLGKTKVALLQSREISESGDPVWELVVQQAPSPALKNVVAATQRATALFLPPVRRKARRPAGDGPPLPDDPIDDVFGSEP
jgi:hypothetical protein